MKKSLLFLLIFSWLSIETLWANESSIYFKANELAKNAKYDEAIKEYQSLIAKGIYNGYIYYNLGYCFFRKGEIGKAIASYKKALLLLPRDGDLKANLADAQKKVVDHIPTTNPQPIWQLMFFWLDWFNMKESILIASLLLTLLFSLLCLRKLAPKFSELVYIPTQTLFILSLFYFIGLSIFVYRQHNHLEGVVTSTEISVKSGLGVDNVTLFTLHDGTIFQIEEERSDWMQIKLANGKKGWIQKEFVEVIR